MKKRNTIVKEAVVLLITAIMIAPMATMAANTKNDQAISLKECTPDGTFVVNSNHQQQITGNDVLWDNGLPDERNGLSCVYYPSYPLDREVVDDFTVPASGWTVTGGHFRIVTYGGYGPEYVTAVKVFFYENNGTKPSTTRFAERTAAFNATLTGDSYFSRPEIAIDCEFTPVNLGPGKWWVCFQPTMEDNNFWLTAEGSGDSVWAALPDQGYPKWTSGFTIFGDNYDVSFKLIGTAGNLPQLQILKISGGIGISAVIKNNGTGAATNVSWTITVTGSIIPIKPKTGSIPTLGIGEEKTIKAIVFGLGKITITVKATCDEGVSTEKNATGLLILIFVIGVK